MIFEIFLQFSRLKILKIKKCLFISYSFYLFFKLNIYIYLFKLNIQE